MQYQNGATIGYVASNLDPKAAAALNNAQNGSFYISTGTGTPSTTGGGEVPTYTPEQAVEAAAYAAAAGKVAKNMPTDLLLSLSSAGIPASALSTALGKLSASDIASIEGGQGFTVYYKDADGNVGSVQQGNSLSQEQMAPYAEASFLASIPLASRISGYLNEGESAAGKAIKTALSAALEGNTPSNPALAASSGDYTRNNASYASQPIPAAIGAAKYAASIPIGLAEGAYGAAANHAGLISKAISDWAEGIGTRGGNANAANAYAAFALQGGIPGTNQTGQNQRMPSSLQAQYSGQGITETNLPSIAGANTTSYNQSINDALAQIFNTFGNKGRIPENTQAAFQYLNQATKPTTSTQTMLSRQIGGLPEPVVENALGATVSHPYGAAELAAVIGAGGLAGGAGLVYGAPVIASYLTSPAVIASIPRYIETGAALNVLGKTITSITQGQLPSWKSLGGAAFTGGEAGALAGVVAPAVEGIFEVSPALRTLLSDAPTLLRAGVTNIPAMMNSALDFGNLLVALQVTNTTGAGQVPDKAELESAWEQGIVFGTIFGALAPAVRVLPEGAARSLANILSGSVGTITGSNLLSLASSGQLSSPSQDLVNGVIGATYAGGMGLAENYGPRLEYLTSGQGVDVGALTLKMGVGREIGLLDVVHDPTGYHLVVGTPSEAGRILAPQLNAQGEPVSLFPSTEGFKAVKTSSGESSDLLTTPFGKSILDKTAADLKSAATNPAQQIDANYLSAWLKVATLMSNAKYPLPSGFNIELEGRTPAENKLLTDLLMKYSDSITQLRGSVASQVQMGGAFNRKPNDLDPTMSSTEKMNALMAEAVQGLNAIGDHQYELDEARNLLTDSKGKHVLNPHVEGETPSEGYVYAAGKTPLGLKQNAPVSIGGMRYTEPGPKAPTEAIERGLEETTGADIKVQSVAQSLKDKISSAIGLRVVSLDNIASAPEEWQKFLQGYADSVDNVKLNQLAPLKDGIARIVSSDGGWLDGSSAVEAQMPEGTFRQGVDVDGHFAGNAADTGDVSKLDFTAEKILQFTKDFYTKEDMDPARVQMTAKGGGGITIYDEGLLDAKGKPLTIADLKIQNLAQNDHPLVTVDNIRMRDWKDVAQDKRNILRYGAKMEENVPAEFAVKSPKELKAESDLALIEQAYQQIKQRKACHYLRSERLAYQGRDRSVLPGEVFESIQSESRFPRTSRRSSRCGEDNVHAEIRSYGGRLCHCHCRSDSALKGQTDATAVANADLLFRTIGDARADGNNRIWLDDHD